MKTFRYRPDIDGMRTLAVVAVVLYHLGLGVPGGFIGVDIFFVISGYLITSIICKDLESGGFSMMRFWERRIRRIFPALVVVVTLVCIAGMLFIYPGELKAFSKEVIAQAMLVSNFYFWQQDGYFAAPLENRPLLHTWSLAVEEQFYFIFPIFLVWLHRSKPRRIMKWVGWILVISFLWSIYGVYRFPTASFFLLPARAWELLLGAVVALYKFKRGFSPWMNELMSWVGVLLMVVPMFLYNRETPFPGLAALPPCLGAALIIFCNHEKMSMVSRLLALPPMVFIGKISYSLYLWHWPLFVFFKYTSVGELSLSLRLWLLAASFVLATLSWKYVETPFRGNRLFSDRKKLFRVFYGITAIFVLFGVLAYRGAKKDGWAWRFSDEVNRITQVTLEPTRHGVAFVDVVDDGKLLKLLGEQSDYPVVPVLVWGDSHANALMPMLQKLCEAHKVNLYCAVSNGYTPLIGNGELPEDRATRLGNKVFELVKKNGIKEVILVGRWNGYVFGTSTLRGEVKVSAELLERQRMFETIFKHTVESLRAAGVRVHVMKQVPLQNFNVPHTMANMMRYEGAGETAFKKMSVLKEAHKKRQRFVDGVIDRSKRQGVQVYDPTGYFARGGSHCRMEIDGVPLYRDRDHLSKLGAMQLEPMFEPLFEHFCEEYLQHEQGGER